MDHIHLNIDRDIALLCFDREGSSANIFDEKVLLELDKALHIVEENHSLNGLVIHSAKPTIFIAGADIKTLSSSPEAEIHNLINLGQSVFDRLETLKIPTVAAIHGACVGGGYELALACDWRVGSDEKCTQIGLPEVQLGLLPAWGGSTRLPNLIGLPKALDSILSGKLYKAKAAHRRGMLDEIVPNVKLIEFAEKMVSKGKREHPLFLQFHNPLSVKVIKAKAAKSLHAKTRGLYPAPLKALEVITDGIHANHLGSLHHELEGFMTLIALPETRELLRLFFLSERQKKLPIARLSKQHIDKVAVIGAGVMGAGIAYWSASRGRTVTLKDVNHAAIAKGMGSIEKLTKGAVKRHVMTATEGRDLMDRISTTTDDIGLHHKQLVIEAAIEKLDIKKVIFSKLAELTNPECILATNTSALPITELAEATPHPERVIGLHFFNPVPRMKLVEVVKTPHTSEAVLADAVKFVQSIGKLPVVVNDSPGFLVNRILMPYLVLAGEFFTEGMNPLELDNKILDFGMPMGPYRLLDEVGLDVAIHVASTLAESFPDRMRVPKVLKQLVELGHFGRKTGKGFYQYKPSSTEWTINPDARALQENRIKSAQRPEEKLIFQMSDEAQRCLEEGVAQSADEIDFAMVMGTGYAPFRGGPMQYKKNKHLHIDHPVAANT